MRMRDTLGYQMELYDYGLATTECSRNCSCRNDCRNRVVQRGGRKDLVLFHRDDEVGKYKQHRVVICVLRCPYCRLGCEKRTTQNHTRRVRMRVRRRAGTYARAPRIAPCAGTCANAVPCARV